MVRTLLSRSINAPANLVFKTVSEIEHFSKAVPAILHVEFLSDIKRGVGTHFRETRLINGKEVSTQLEVKEFVPDTHVRIVAESHGTIWDSVFIVTQLEDRTELTMVMDASTTKLIPKLFSSLMSGGIRRAIEKDLDSVKWYCEKQVSFL